MSTPDQEHEERLRKIFQWPEPLLQCYFKAVRRNSLNYGCQGIEFDEFRTFITKPDQDILPFRKLVAWVDPTRRFVGNTDKAKMVLEPLVMFDDDRERSPEIQPEFSEHELIVGDNAGLQQIQACFNKCIAGPTTYYEVLWVTMVVFVVSQLKVRLFWWHIEHRDEEHNVNQINARFRYDGREWTWTLNLDIIKRYKAQIEADTNSHETTSLRLQ